MKNLYFLLIFLMLVSCAQDKTVYWCGDHACISKKERELYFKKTMIVEVKNIDVKSEKATTDIEKITKDLLNEERKQIKHNKIEKKRAKLEKKRKIKEQKSCHF